MTRPQPPAQLLAIGFTDDGALPPSFVPAQDLRDWLLATFIEEDAPLLNEDHAHLRYARIGCLWTCVPNARSGRSIVGQAEMGRNVGGSTTGRWGKARAIQQMEGWFGEVPDFVITIFAPYAAECGDDEFCALIEHELYHCGIERDRETGEPRFTKEGMPVFAMRGHDVEEFTGIVKRYGADAAHVREFIEAASQPPAIATASIGAACGNCAMPRLVSVRG